MSQQRIYQVEFLRSAEKELASLPRDAQRRVGAALDQLRHEPRPPGAKALQGDGKRLRIRVGDYRVIETNPKLRRGKS